MLRAERLNQLRAIARSQKVLRSQDIAQQFAVSEVTARKDIQLLADEGLVRRTFGGAVLCSDTPEEDGAQSLAPTTQVTITNAQDKLSIAQAALACIDPGETIFLGSGGTCCLLAELIPNESDISVVTNNITAVPILIDRGINVHLIGGEVATLKHGLLFSSISDPLPYLHNICISKAFTSCYGFNVASGITVNSHVSTYIYRVLPQIQDNWYMMLTPEKFQQTGMYRVGKLSMVNHLIAAEIPDDILTQLSKERMTQVWE